MKQCYLTLKYFNHTVLNSLSMYTFSSLGQEDFERMFFLSLKGGCQYVNYWVKSCGGFMRKEFFVQLTREKNLLPELHTL